MCSFDVPEDRFVAGNVPEAIRRESPPANRTGKPPSGRTHKTSERTISGHCCNFPSGQIPRQMLENDRLHEIGRCGPEAAGFRFRVDKNDKTVPGFDNTEPRAVRRTTIGRNTKPYRTASESAYGALQSGKRQIRVPGMAFGIVDESVPTTGFGKKKHEPPSQPTNPDFSQ